MRGRNTTHRTLEDWAGILLAHAFGYGWSFVTGDVLDEAEEASCDSPAQATAIKRELEEGEDGVESLNFASLDFSGDDDTASEAATTLISIARETEVTELARRYIDKRHLPKWIEKLPENERKSVISWSANHSIASKDKERPREFAHWKRYTRMFRPVAPSGYRAAYALSRANLPGPLQPTLLLFTLEETTQLPTVLRYLSAVGIPQPSAKYAIAAMMFYGALNRGELKSLYPSGNNERVRREVRLAQACLRDWLHRASREFLGAYRQKPERDAPCQSRNR